jgi:hypothetical protein
LLECRCGSLQICVDRLRLSKNLREISSARAFAIAVVKAARDIG